jgi:hypothetical protein
MFSLSLVVAMTAEAVPREVGDIKKGQLGKVRRAASFKISCVLRYFPTKTKRQRERKRWMKDCLF